MNSTANRSTFVTAVAWIFIVLSGMATLMSLLQNVMVHLVFDRPEFAHAMQAPPSGLPAFAVFLAGHMKLFFGVFLVVSAFKFATSIGLLLRRNWARMVFVGFMVFGIVWNLGGLALQFAILSSLRDTIPQAPNAPDMGPFFVAMGIVITAFALLFSGIFGWIAKRLLSPAVAAEFRSVA